MLRWYNVYMNQRYEKSHNDTELTLRQKAVRLLAAVAVAGTTAAIMNGFSREAHFSEETGTYRVQPGDGVWDVTNEIDNVDGLPDRSLANDYVKDMPENQKVFEDGMLQPGEIVEYPQEAEYR